MILFAIPSAFTTFVGFNSFKAVQEVRAKTPNLDSRISAIQSFYTETKASSDPNKWNAQSIAHLTNLSLYPFRNACGMLGSEWEKGLKDARSIFIENIGISSIHKNPFWVLPVWSVAVFVQGFLSYQKPPTFLPIAALITTIAFPFLLLFKQEETLQNYREKILFLDHIATSYPKAEVDQTRFDTFIFRGIPYKNKKQRLFTREEMGEIADCLALNQEPTTLVKVEA